MRTDVNQMAGIHCETLMETSISLNETNPKARVLNELKKDNSVGRGATRNKYEGRPGAVRGVRANLGTLPPARPSERRSMFTVIDFHPINSIQVFWQ